MKIRFRLTQCLVAAAAGLFGCSESRREVAERVPAHAAPEKFVSADSAGISEVRGIVEKLDRISGSGCDLFEYYVIRTKESDVLVEPQRHPNVQQSLIGKSVRIAVPKKAQTMKSDGKLFILVDWQAEPAVIVEEATATPETAAPEKRTAP